jgi:hypothetical protein
VALYICGRGNGPVMARANHREEGSGSRREAVSVTAMWSNFVSLFVHNFT